MATALSTAAQIAPDGDLLEFSAPKAVATVACHREEDGRCSSAATAESFLCADCLSSRFGRALISGPAKPQKKLAELDFPAEPRW
jgi:hypothetical protein